MLGQQPPVFSMASVQHFCLNRFPVEHYCLLIENGRPFCASFGERRQGSILASPGGRP
jgi:hypothetical protein